MYSALCPNGNGERFATHIFRAFDLDKSNTVDFREFLIGLSMTSTSSSLETKLQWIFHVFDIDGNGLLTRNECLEVIDIIVRFNYSKENNDDEEHPEVERLVRSAKRCMMRIFDNVSDGLYNTLTITQFVEGCVEDELISQILATSSRSRSDSLMTKNVNEIANIDES
jgi:Ca2+-binding EF-hand superfamily protein